MVPPAASTAPQGGEPWLPWVLSAAFLALGFLVWQPFPPGIWHDDGVYVLLGRALAEGEGLRYLGVTGNPPAPKFPPLFPLVLSLVWRVFPSFPENVTVLSGVNVVVTALAGGAFFAYLRRALRIEFNPALLITLVAWASAHLWRVAAVPLSEPLFLLLMIGALWAGARMEARPRSGTALLFLLMAGLAVHTRTLGIALLLGGILSLAVSKEGRLALLTAVGALALVLPWTLWTAGAASEIPAPLRDTLGPYGGWLLSQIAGQPVEFGAFAWANVGSLLARILNLLLPGVPGRWLLLGIPLFTVLLAGLWDLFLRSRTLVFGLAGSLGILVLWPFQEIRLLVPFQPLLVAALVMGFRRILEALPVRKIARTALLGVGGAWVTLFLVVSILRLGGGWVGEAYRIRSEALLEGVRAVVEKTPPDAVVGAPELWAALHLYTGRTVTPSARFRPLARESPIQGTPEAQYKTWISGGLTHLLVEHGGRVHGEALDRVDARCPPGTVQLLDSRPGQYLVALAWDEACRDELLEGGS